MLVVLICVREYKSSLLKRLNGTQIDKQRLLQLFKKHYNYTIITNKNSFVTAHDVESILSTAKTQFASNDYDGIMIFYSGHGNRDHLTLSDYKKRRHERDDGVYSRSRMEQYFNGYNIDNKEKTMKHKFYFIDSCRGDDDSVLFKMEINQNDIRKGHTFKYLHPEMNRSIMYSNSNNYASYEAPFNKDTGDIDWDKLGDEEKYDKNGEMCGMFMNAVFHGFAWNVSNGYNMNFADIQDKMRDKAYGEVPVKGDFKCKVGIEIDESGNLRNSDKRRMVFRRNENTIDWCMKPGPKMNFECLSSNICEVYQV